MNRPRLCFIATAWGSQKGGIDVLNMRLALAARSYAEVSCVVLTPAKEQPPSIKLSVVDATQLAAQVAAIRASQAVPPDWWIGHDVHTGPIANACRRALELSCVVNHMDYLSYKGLDLDPRTAEKAQRQRAVFREANIVAAVGPKLFRTVHEMTTTRVTQVLPGCEEVLPAEPSGRFSLVISGRLAPDTDSIKQYEAATLAFADCVRERELGPDPVMSVVGMDEDNFSQLARRASQRANGACNLVNEGIVDAPKRYSEILGRQAVAVVPSVYEGFSLVGWEALSAGIPTILSTNTGLAEFVTNSHLPMAALELVDIRGHLQPPVTSTQGKADEDAMAADTQPNETDVRSLREAYVRVFSQFGARKSAALEMRAALRSEYQWSDTAAQFVSALNDTLNDKYSSVALGALDGAQIHTASALSAKLSSIALLASHLRALARSVLIPDTDRPQLADGRLDLVSEPTLARVVESWIAVPWDLYLSYSRSANRESCLRWVLGMTIPVKGRRVWSVSPYGIRADFLERELESVFVRARRVGPAPHVADTEDGQLVATATATLGQRVVEIIVNRLSPPLWLLVADPRVRAAVDADTRDIRWRKAAL